MTRVPGDIGRKHEYNFLDKETGVLVSDFFDFLVEWEIKRSFRYQDFTTLLILEPDRRPRAPETLETLVSLIKKNIRETDLIGRLGNTKFGVLLLKSDLDRAYGIASRIMDHICKYIFSHEKVQYVTISIGGACFPTNLASNEKNDFFRKAEDAFKVAKSKRKSIYFPDLPVSKNSGGE
jgi:DNA-binding Xre family transcriptional regulator